jgi:hypothetical protein
MMLTVLPADDEEVEPAEVEPEDVEPDEVEPEDELDEQAVSPIATHVTAPISPNRNGRLA